MAVAVKELCGKWMPRGREYCARSAGHKDQCLSLKSVERKRTRGNERRQERRADPAYRDSEQKRMRERYTTDPERRERIREYQREWYREHCATNPEYMQRKQEYQRERYRNNRTTILAKSKDLLYKARRRAVKGGLPFDLTLEWVMAALETAVENGCPYLAIPIRLDCKANDPHCPSIDQFYPREGYTQNNCVVISFKANVMKNDCPPWLVEKFGRNISHLARTEFRRHHAA
jgi:hypothetical protein